MLIYRHRRFEKAFRLAVDIKAKDLFMVCIHSQTINTNSLKSIMLILGPITWHWSTDVICEAKRKAESMHM